MRKKIVWILCCIPWIFLTLYADWTYRIAWQYGLALALMAVEAGILADSGKLLLFGNLLSFFMSMLLVRLCGFDAMNHYFKPFTAYGWVMVLTGISGILQMLVWKKNQMETH